MNIDFTDAFEQGMSEQEALEMIQRICREEQEKAEAIVKAQASAHRIKEQEQAKADEEKKEALKAEGRAHLINAVICYSEAFDLLEEGDTWTQEDVDRVEALLKRMEAMAPMYLKLFDLGMFGAIE